jgi:nicotinate-nucleotide--dimethylbenzimidazole phosphoribosyltransferase
MLNFQITGSSRTITKELKHKIDNKTKPVGSLGDLENIALQIGCVQKTLSPVLKNPTIIVFAGDHGIAQSGVSLYPQEVTYQMVLNFLRGGAAINVFCKQNDVEIKVVDAGVINLFEDNEALIQAKVAHGTKNFLEDPAMTEEECMIALYRGTEIVKNTFNDGCNIIGFGEMGIANTSSAAIILSYLANIPLEKSVGRGTGLNEEGVQNKYCILKRAVNKHSIDPEPLKVLQTFGGFEIAMMCGAMLQAAEHKMILLIDGFISTAALLVAYKLYPAILDYCIFCHNSNEQGHKLMLEYLKIKPVLNLNLRLGEGTGAALAYPVVKAAVTFLNDMASFDSASVSKSKSDEC